MLIIKRFDRNDRKTNFILFVFAEDGPLTGMYDRWGKDYRAFKLLRNNADYKAYMTYLNYASEIQSMIYTTNWIERLNLDFRRVTRMRTAMPKEGSVLTLLGRVAMEYIAFDRLLPNITCDKTLFPTDIKRFSLMNNLIIKVEPPLMRRLLISTISGVDAAGLPPPKSLFYRPA